MTSRREKTPAKRMRRIALVICEGETEENYTNLLKKWYKSPIRINYNKATFTDTQQNLLKDNLKTALIRAKNLIDFQNPSTNVYKLIEVLESSANG